MFYLKDIDYIILTGDLVPHEIWETRKETNLEIIQYTMDQISKKFAGIPLFSAVGNHESSPVNL